MLIITRSTDGQRKCISRQRKHKSFGCDEVNLIENLVGFGKVSYSSQVWSE